MSDPSKPKNLTKKTYEFNLLKGHPKKWRGDWVDGEEDKGSPESRRSDRKRKGE